MVYPSDLEQYSKRRAGRKQGAMPDECFANRYLKPWERRSCATGKTTGIDGIDSSSQGDAERKSWRRPSLADLSEPAFREKLAQGLRGLSTPGDPDAQSFKSKSDPKVTHYVTKDADGVPRCTCAAEPGKEFCSNNCREAKAGVSCSCAHKGCSGTR